MHETTKISSATVKPNVLDEQSKVQLQKAVKDFESIFVGYLLKNMRSSIPDSTLFGDGFGGDLVEEMFDTELAKHISHNSNLGLAEMLYRQVTGEDLPKETRHLSRTVPRSTVTQPAQKAVTVSATDKLEMPKSLNERVNNFDTFINEAAEQHGLDANIIKAVIASESAGNQFARSSKEAKGLMQLIDSTATAMGVRNVWNPRENIMGGAKYLKQMMERFDGDLKLALASYNAGPGAVEKHGGVPPYKETQQYVKKVMNYLRRFEQQELPNDKDN